MTYDLATVEELMPGVWDSMKVLTAVDEHAPDADMPRAPDKDPRRSSDKQAMVADVQDAWRWADLEHRERQVLLLAYGFSEPHRSIETILNIRNGTASGIKMDALATMVHYLNRTTPEDYLEELTN